MCQPKRDFTALVDFLLSQPGILRNPEYEFLLAKGWIPLGEEAFTGKYGWTTMQRGIQGALHQEEALKLEGWKPCE